VTTDGLTPNQVVQPKTVFDTRTSVPIAEQVRTTIAM